MLKFYIFGMQNGNLQVSAILIPYYETFMEIKRCFAYYHSK